MESGKNCNEKKGQDTESMSKTEDAILTCLSVENIAGVGFVQDIQEGHLPESAGAESRDGGRHE